jgi:hypothetical protein
MRLGAIDLHLSNETARLLEKFLGEQQTANRHDQSLLEDLRRILETKLATARPRRG